MWTFPQNRRRRPNPPQEPSDDDVSSVMTSRDQGLECPICWESFNIVENIPYVLWCGHTLCKICILRLQRAVARKSIQLPLFVSCPWCNLLSFRLVYKGNLKFPCKNYLLLWMVESKTRERPSSYSCPSDHHHHNPVTPPSDRPVTTRVRRRRERTRSSAQRLDNWRGGHLSMERVKAVVRRSVVVFVHMTAKFPLVIIFILIVGYAIPACAAILAVYVVITVLFALPAFLILYFAYPSLDWIVREIITR